MFIVLLRFGPHKSRAGALMEGHKQWIKAGLDDGVFLAVGSLENGTGGALLAQHASRAELQARVNQDPFVAEGVVSAEIIGVDVSQTDERLKFLVV